MSNQIHVAVGVVVNKQGQYFISKRHDHLHQGGLWEFPGGKVEPGESVLVALARELNEELGIQVKQAQPLVKLSYEYPDKTVLLDVWLVNSFKGIAKSQQGQADKWVSLSELSSYKFPAANRGIINCLNYPVYYAITGQYQNIEDYTNKLKQCLTKQPMLVQCRVKEIGEKNLTEIVRVSKQLCEQYNTRLIVNSDISILDMIDVDGIHLNSKRLFEFTSRPIASNKIFAASVHNIRELNQAKHLKADLIVVSPVLKTTSHPCESTLGWEGLNQLVSQSDIPVFALGGMKKAMLEQVKQTGAYGLAAISEFWG